MEMSLIQMFQDRGCLQIADSNKFTYASGLKGPIYCDNRLILGSPELRKFVLNEITSIVKENNIHFEAIMAMATGGIALGTLLADKLNLPLGYVRSQKKGHGKGELIEGGVPKDKKILIFEDLINQGSSISRGVEALVDDGYQVGCVVSIVNYEFDVSRKYFDQKSIPVLSAIGFNDLLKFFSAKDTSLETYQSLKNWHDQMNK